MGSLPVIDESKCTLCGRCVSVCPKEVLRLDREAVAYTGEECMTCGHCRCVCPADAVRFDPAVLAAPAFTTFACPDRYTVPGSFDPAALVSLLRSRRSVRRYQDRPVPDGVVADLVAAAVSAPSASNCQDWEFTLVNGREQVWKLAREIGRFFARLNRLAANPLVRYGSVPFLGRSLVDYYDTRFEKVKRHLEEAEQGRDVLFHGAPCVVICHGPTGGSLPLEDAQYATYNMALLAHALGLGTCYIGYASAALNKDRRLRRRLGLAAGHRVHAVLVLGYPAVTFERTALRRPWKMSAAAPLR
ncbi:MAG TPA: nitroreductase family protein [Myxococcota bacterium]|nr:nitroreductase family protein [Myxococcota bacterium]HRY92489.1 nitroreductase family protein [Myxococcota bacterium]HSA22629.1 nitroreductase family protein [Myxococcota bacterium]